MSSIFYINFNTLFKIIYYNILTEFYWKRALTTIIFLILYFIIATIVVFFRLVDEILFPSYRKIKIEQPLFIISNPRSGTTFMHRLLCLDNNKWVYTKLYETILPSITLYKLVDGIAFLDKKTGSPMKRFFEFIDRKIFGGWKDIHPMGFNQSEEDEAFYVFSTVTAGLFLLVPFISRFQEVRFPDTMSAHDTDAYMRNYENSLKRLMYAKGSTMTYLSKNVLSTGRLKALTERFPGARIIYLIRNPYNSVPSLTSMFKAAWKFHSPQIEDNSDLARGLGWLAIDFYKYFDSLRSQIPEEQMLTIRYEDLVADPVKTVEKIYGHFGYSINDDFRKRLLKNSARSKNYKSTHHYSLEQFGFDKKLVHDELYNIFKRFEFEE